MPIILRKIRMPELQTEHSPRPRLREAISRVVMSHRVTAVSATAGSGKTTAVAEALLGCDQPVAWVSLDKSDQSTGRLLAYIDAALSEHSGESDRLVIDAHSARLPQAEVAGLLAESFQNEGIILVLDNIERLQRNPEAWAVIDALARYMHDDAHIVLIGREPLSPGLLNIQPGSTIGRIGAETLALTLDEANDLFRRLGRPPAELPQRVRSVDGWIAGVLFAPDTFDPSTLAGVDPLQDFLSDHIMSSLHPEDRQFLVRTSILSEVDVRQTEAMGLTDAFDRVESLRQLHLPATWDKENLALRVHPRFREHLQQSFARLPTAEQQQLRSSHARLLVSEHDFESAVEEFHRAGDRGAAIALARECIEDLLDRGDIPLVEMWLQRWGRSENPEEPTSLSVAQLAVAVARDRIGEALEVVDRIDRAGALEEFVRESDRGAQLSGWVYSMCARVDEIKRILTAARPTPAMQALLYTVSLITPGPPAPRPVQSNGPLDILIFECDYYLGILTEFTYPVKSRLVELLMGPTRIASMRAQGRTQAALDAYRAYESSVGQMHMHAIVGPELLMDAGLPDEAQEIADRGFEMAEAGGNYFYLRANLIVQAKLALRHRHDPVRAKFLLSQGDNLPRFAYLDEVVDLWLGFALLQERDDDAAVKCLRQVVRAMQANKHLLDLSTACVYLAEAEWRCGDPDAADRAAEEAIRAAKTIGTNHVLLQALADFPAVLARRLDAEASTDSEWHSLRAPLSMQRFALPLKASTADASLHDFGSPFLLVNNEPVQPRLMKTYELLAFLTTQPNFKATRDRLIDVLFGEKDNSQARTYLRQVLKWLRLVLPDGSLVVDSDYIALDPGITIATESALFERLAVESTRLQGQARIEAMSDALSIIAAGVYLAPLNSEWIDERRTRVSGIALDLEFALAKHLMDADRTLEANILLERALGADPLREEGWRLRMRMASEFHDIDGVIRAYNSCRAALSKIGVAPSSGTQRLLRDLTA